MFSTPAFAQTAGGPSAAGGFAAYSGFVPIVLMVVIFYFLLIRPQQSRMKQHKAMLDAVKRGDTVVTGGGLVAKVTRVDGEEVELDLGGTRVRAVKSTLSEVRGLPSKPAND
jgi:preprotein translocase subunit YajC